MSTDTGINRRMITVSIMLATIIQALDGMSAGPGSAFCKTDGAMLGAPMPQAPVYATRVLNQPLAQANSAAEGIVSRNLH